ncbi:MAG: hypothetical protein ABIU06_10015, partial [Anaerolineales bacterium]
GTIHLLDGKTLQEIDNYSIPEAIDPAFATGFGTMSVHEVAMDQAEDIGYLSWYDAGIRVIRFGPSGIEEVGHYIDVKATTSGASKPIGCLVTQLRRPISWAVTATAACGSSNTRVLSK